MSEKWKQKILLIFPFAVLAAGMMLTTAFFLHTYRQIAFEKLRQKIKKSKQAENPQPEVQSDANVESKSTEPAKDVTDNEAEADNSEEAKSETAADEEINNSQETEL